VLTRRGAAEADRAAAQFDKQAIDAATAHERAYQAALAKGDLPFLGRCAPGADSLPARRNRRRRAGLFARDRAGCAWRGGDLAGAAAHGRRKYSAFGRTACAWTATAGGSCGRRWSNRISR
jgi:hypothetical protein